MSVKCDIYRIHSLVRDYQGEESLLFPIIYFMCLIDVCIPIGDDGKKEKKFI